MTMFYSYFSLPLYSRMFCYVVPLSRAISNLSKYVPSQDPVNCIVSVLSLLKLFLLSLFLVSPMCVYRIANRLDRFPPGAGVDLLTLGVN